MTLNIDRDHVCKDFSGHWGSQGICKIAEGWEIEGVDVTCAIKDQGVFNDYHPKGAVKSGLEGLKYTGSIWDISEQRRITCSRCPWVTLNAGRNRGVPQKKQDF